MPELDVLVQTRMFLIFVFVGFLLGGLLFIYMFHPKVQLRTALRLGPFAGASLAILLHAILCYRGAFQLEMGLEEFVFTHWLQEGAAPFADLTAICFVYPLVLLFVVGYPMFFQYWPLRPSLRNGEAMDVQPAQREGVFFSGDAERRQWAGAVRWTFLGIAAGPLITSSLIAVASYMRSLQFEGDRVAFLFAALPALFLLFWIGDQLLDFLSTPSDA